MVNMNLVFSEFIDYSSCLLEWDTLKECMLSSYKECNLVEFGLKLTTDEALYIHYPSLSKLAEIVLLYPACTAEVERGFSFQNAIKTKFRNRLGPVHLDQLLRLRLNSPTVDKFPFHMAYTHWLESKRRRNVIQKPAKEKIDIDDSDSSDDE